MEKKKRLGLLAAALAAFLLVGGTLAVWIAESPSIHIINTGRLAGRVVEEYRPPAEVRPGMTVDKVVNVKNVGSVDMLVRVKITRAWGDRRGADGKVIPVSLPTDNIQIAFNRVYWLDGGDGYYYYKGILKSGETTREPLFEAFTVSADTGNAYKNKLADIIVTMEALQAGGDALSLWNKTYAQLSIAAPTAPTGQTTGATFVNPTDKFRFNPAGADLFANFKELAPGETRVQSIRVDNAYRQAVEIFVRAEFAEQTLATAENLALVNEMLQRYATVVITDSTGRTLYQGAVWGNYPKEPAGNDSMKNYISLGVFTSGQVKNLTATLTLAPELDNRYQNLWGRIQWRWLAQGDDAAVYSPDPSQSGAPRPSSSGSGPSPCLSPDDEHLNEVDTPSRRPGTSQTPGNPYNPGNPGGNPPKTGEAPDFGRIVAYLLLCAAACTGVYCLIAYRRKKREDEAGGHDPYLN